MLPINQRGSAGCGCIVLLLIIGFLLFRGDSCNYDSDFIPYLLKGYDVYVYNGETGEEYYAGRIGANYFTRTKGLSGCQS